MFHFRKGENLSYYLVGEMAESIIVSPLSPQKIMHIFEWRDEVCFFAWHNDKPQINSLGKTSEIILGQPLYVVWSQYLETPKLPEITQADWLPYVKEEDLWFIYHLGREIHVRYDDSGKIRHIKFYAKRFLQTPRTDARLEFCNRKLLLHVNGKNSQISQYPLENLTACSQIMPVDGGYVVTCKNYRTYSIYLNSQYRIEKIL